MAVDVSTEIVIDRPPSEVSAFAAGPGQRSTWYVNIKQVQWMTPRPLTVGSRVAFVAQFLGRTMAYTYEVADFVPGEQVVMRTADGPFPMETTYRWRSAGDGRTRMTLRNCGTPSGFSRWVAPFMTFAIRRANRKDLALLKQILEHR